ncbi:MAG: DUF4250 domain-containing protein [Muribaculaceae bacterium]|jgi:hypothetical protein|nr:DUF4250 domain-containing protein [Muribaculaceae bacterium]
MDNKFGNMPQDAAMLLSYVNMKLRDSYSSIEELCDDMGFDTGEFISYMASKGWEYNRDAKKFW